MVFDVVEGEEDGSNRRGPIVLAQDVHHDDDVMQGVVAEVDDYDHHFWI